MTASLPGSAFLLEQIFFRGNGSGCNQEAGFYLSGLQFSDAQLSWGSAKMFIISFVIAMRKLSVTKKSYKTIENIFE